MHITIQDINVRFQDPKPRGLSKLLWPARASEKCTSSKWVLQNLKLEVEKNDFCVILGASGAGKTTLLRTIAGLVKPSSGRIFTAGRDITDWPPHRRDLAFVFQSGGWYDHLTVLQHLKYEGRSKSEMEGLLDQFQLSKYAHHRPSELSGGQSQRLAICRAVSRSRSLLLLDEPLSQLDPSLRASLRQLMQSIHATGKTILYATHDQQDAMSLATKIAILHRGKIQQVGTPKELFYRPNHRCVAEVFGQPSMQFFQIPFPAGDYANGVCTNDISNRTLPADLLRAIEANLIATPRKGEATKSLWLGVRPSEWCIEAWNPKDLLSRAAELPCTSNCLQFVGQFADDRFLGLQNRLRFRVKDRSSVEIFVHQPKNENRVLYVPGNFYRLSVSSEDVYLFDEEGDCLPFEPAAEHDVR